MTKFLGGVVFATVFKLIFYVVSTAIKLIANILVFFGLYIPFFYLIYGEMLLLFTDFVLVPYTSDLGLYIFGLVLSCFCSVIISVKNLIVKPIKAVLGRDDKEDGHYYEERRRRPPMRYTGGDYPRPRRQINPPIRSRQYGYYRIDSPYEYFDRIDSFYEHPEIYRSEVRPDIIVYEYHDRFDLYRHNGDILEYVETKYR
jgi:hypothetical protein